MSVESTPFILLQFVYSKNKNYCCLSVLLLLFCYPYYITRFCSGGDDYVGWDLHDYAGFGMPRGKPGLPPAARPRSAPHPRRGGPMRQPSVTPAREWAPVPNSASGGRGKAASRGRLNPSPGTGRIRGKQGFTAYSEGFPSRGLTLYTKI